MLFANAQCSRCMSMRHALSGLAIATASQLALSSTCSAGVPPFLFINSTSLLVGKGIGPMDVGAGDFNLDGLPDIVVAGQGESRGFILITGKVGEPAYNPPVLIPVDTDAPSEHRGQGIAVADFNNDGKLDVAFSRELAGVTISAGNGDGTFAAPVVVIEDVSIGKIIWPLRLTTFELDNDGDIDLLLVDGRGVAIYVFRNDGDLEFTLIQTFLIKGVTQIAPGDLNGDGLDDLAWAKSSVGAVIAFNDGVGGFAEPIEFETAFTPYDITIVDLDLDGIDDIILGDADSPKGRLIIMINDGTGTSYEVSEHDIPIIGPTEVVPADFDGDQRIDMAVLDVLGLIWFVRNETTTPGEFAFSFPFHIDTGGASSRRLIAANVDQDCDHDLLVINVTPSSVTLIENLSAQFNQCTIADFDFSGEVDGDDLGFLLGEWGKAGSPADLDLSGRVEGWDLAILLWAWQQPVP